MATLERTVDRVTKGRSSAPRGALAAPAALSPRALYQEVADRLRDKIFSRELEPGAWIDELKLAAECWQSKAS